MLPLAFPAEEVGESDSNVFRECNGIIATRDPYGYFAIDETLGQDQILTEAAAKLTKNLLQRGAFRRRMKGSAHTPPLAGQ